MSNKIAYEMDLRVHISTPEAPVLMSAQIGLRYGSPSLSELFSIAFSVPHSMSPGANTLHTYRFPFPSTQEDPSVVHMQHLARRMVM
ncbi:sexual differentiation process protein isp4 [Anopheles sinensis]|uniref:Sexual differentiation process protein isp4 n=1 Tax=Anopheles sinensis TaxID=74873 RepID=A0A084WCN6_ANOSI|nr:sexual differentiation process protein isp4 [Anopheles sinensis]